MASLTRCLRYGRVLDSRAASFVAPAARFSSTPIEEKGRGDEVTLYSGKYVGNMAKAEPGSSVRLYIEKKTGVSLVPVICANINVCTYQEVQSFLDCRVSVSRAHHVLAILRQQGPPCVRRGCTFGKRMRSS